MGTNSICILGRLIRSSVVVSIRFSYVFKKFNEVAYSPVKFDFEQDDCFEWIISFSPSLNIFYSHL